MQHAFPLSRPRSSDGRANEGTNGVRIASSPIGSSEGGQMTDGALGKTISVHLRIFHDAGKKRGKPLPAKSPAMILSDCVFSLVVSQSR